MSKKFAWGIGVIAILSLVLSISGRVGDNQSGPSSSSSSKSQPDGRAGGPTNYDTLGLDSNNGTIFIDWERGQLSATQDQAVFTNNTGATRFYDFAELTTTASTTGSFRLSVFSTTTASVPNEHDFTLLNFSADQAPLIFTAMATSTEVATSTNSILAAAKSVVTLVNGTPATFVSSGDGTIAVRDGWSLIIYKQALDAGGGRCTGSDDCPTATSSDSIGIDYFLTWHATSTPR